MSQQIRGFVESFLKFLKCVFKDHGPDRQNVSKHTGKSPSTERPKRYNKPSLPHIVAIVPALSEKKFTKKYIFQHCRNFLLSSYYKPFHSLPASYKFEDLLLYDFVFLLSKSCWHPHMLFLSEKQAVGKTAQLELVQFCLTNLKCFRISFYLIRHSVRVDCCDFM